jgi:hypothetical protein
MEQNIIVGRDTGLCNLNALTPNREYEMSWCYQDEKPGDHIL